MPPTIISRRTFPEVENVYFVSNNKHNAELLSRNKKCTFCDDCGVYKQGNSVKTDYSAVDSNGSIFYLEKKR